ncbi:MAG: tetraprenyl-beta-curcumene synthase family protein [Firmicutes bacterium]|nr:tetraprenyl-beta-curcumene synthase family protein [Bacillota bacterium]
MLEQLRQTCFLNRFIFSVLPRVDRELSSWEAGLDRHGGDPVLRRQALSSLHLKRFHAQGGSVFALRHPGWEDRLVDFIVSFQTISDYLDNLCDRMNVLEAEPFRLLHRSMLDSLAPSAASRDYYRLYPCRDDGGYLERLVGKTRAALSALPGRRAAVPRMEKLVSLYTDLQTYKHIDPGSRAPALRDWAGLNRADSLGIEWWEFSAAAGSTLGVFALAAAATSPGLTGEECDKLVQAYFPWICGLHILLDYLIDQEEDRLGGDFNFTRCYPDTDATARRLALFVRESLARASTLPDPAFHSLVVKGLLALYLSDPKADHPDLAPVVGSLIERSDPSTRMILRLCRFIRSSRVVRRRLPFLQPVKSGG